MMAMRSLIAGLIVLAIVGSPPARAQTTTSFLITGDVVHPTTIDLAALEALPPTQANVTYSPAGGPQKTTAFTGALLWDLLQSVGIVLDPSIENDILRKIVIVTGSDGYQAVFGAGEIAPEFGGNQVIIAYRKNGKPIRRNGVAEIVAPGDKEDGRFVHFIARIEVRDVGK